MVMDNLIMDNCAKNDNLYGIVILGLLKLALLNSF